MENVNIQECPVLVASVFLTQLVIFFPSQKEGVLEVLLRDYKIIWSAQWLWDNLTARIAVNPSYFLKLYKIFTLFFAPGHNIQNVWENRIENRRRAKNGARKCYRDIRLQVRRGMRQDLCKQIQRAETKRRSFETKVLIWMPRLWKALPSKGLR